MEGNDPVARIRIGNITAAVWKNETANGGFHSVTLQRSYKEGDQWKQTHSFGHDDLLNAAKVLERAENWISRAK